jgi:anti-sigma factor RsiW
VKDVHDPHPGPGDVHDLAALHAVDALEPAEQAIFETHLPGCPRCQAEIVDYTEVTAHLAQAVAQDPPPALRTTVLDTVHGAASSPAHAGIDRTEVPVRSRPAEAPMAPMVSLDARRRRHRRLLAAAAAAVLVPGVALGGWGLGVQSEQRQQQQLAAQEQDRANRLLAAPDVTTHRIEVEGRTATVVVSQQEDAALFVSTDLPDPGQGREYQLWLLQEDIPIPGAHFTGGQVRTWLDGEVADAGAIAMTIEPAGGSTTPTLPVLAATEI